MAEEAFALSPISARASLPSEADYDAIREAFMETSRGRWFLSEYAKRNRNADTSMVLDAVARIEQTIAAQKQAPANELIDSLGAIRAIVGEARASVAQAIAGLAGGETLSAAHDGARIIREIAWTLRECGADTRICDLLDSQVGAIDSGHRQIAAISSEAILATFDQLMRRIGDLAGADADTPAADDAASSNANAEHAAAAPVTEDQSPKAAVGEAVAETTSAMAPDHVETAMQVEAPAATAQHSVPEAYAETAPDAAPAVHSEIAPHVDNAADVAIETQAETAAQVEFEPRAETATDGEIEPLAEAASQIGFEPHAAADAEAALGAENSVYSEPAAPHSIESEIEQPEQPEMLDPETVHEAAVLDLVALEMAADDAADEAVAEPPQIEPAQIDSVQVEAAPIKSAAIGAVEAKSAIAAPVAREPSVSFASIAAAEASLTGEASASVPPPSLGAALLASGAVSKPAAPGVDPLAPIRRMTQIEKIAFFS